MTKIFIKIFVSFCFSIVLKPQIVIDSSGVPRDNYFSIQTAENKVHKLFPSAKKASAVLPAGINAAYEVKYKYTGKRYLTFDMFSPAKKGIYPCVILIHGGGWRSGNKKMEWPMAMQIALEGYVTVAVEYRLSPEAKYPAAVIDIKSVIKYLKAHYKNYNIDINKFAVGGCSSGGLLAALIGTTAKSDKFIEINEEAGTANVNAIINVDGYSDFTKSDATKADTAQGESTSETRWLGKTYKEDPLLWKEASPLYYVDNNSPPVLFINSSLPRYHAGRDDMIRKLKVLNIYCEVHEIANTPHPFWLFEPWCFETKAIIVSFLKKVLK